ncbi:hypothetical protein HMPREF1987_01983 [Peptostreptococcaceae bacterium oral taxon 113 str. W5053]|nr:hypothetical protein HMPREF1987_01983 [Peptostreptococcaceae bacterium oral taxon 113 str. W5053]
MDFVLFMSKERAKFRPLFYESDFLQLGRTEIYLDYAFYRFLRLSVRFDAGSLQDGKRQEILADSFFDNQFVYFRFF